jgi:CRISPR system Cascade subunit CasD
MREFLLLTVYAPLASWGDIAVGELRGSWDRPSRSALLGLIAGALGIERADQDAHDALDRGYGIAVRLDAPGSPLVDYHTVQTVRESARRGRQGEPWAAVLTTTEPETMLSRRTYRTDVLAVVALWSRDGARWPLSDLAAALETPTFSPYAGRKSNPLGLPLDPVVVTAASLADAFKQRASPPPEVLPLERVRPDAAPEVAHDPCDGFPSGLVPVRRELRRDAAPQRGRWQFAERVVEIGVFPSGAVP